MKYSKIQVRCTVEENLIANFRQNSCICVWEQHLLYIQDVFTQFIKQTPIQNESRLLRQTVSGRFYRPCKSAGSLETNKARLNRFDFSMYRLASVSKKFQETQCRSEKWHWSFKRTSRGKKHSGDEPAQKVKVQRTPKLSDGNITGVRFYLGETACWRRECTRSAGQAAGPMLQGRLRRPGPDLLWQQTRKCSFL